MGRSGTEVAREAADIVLTDDDFSTLVAALEEGRRIADNVRKVVAYLLSANLGEVVFFAVAVLAGIGAPMSVVQVLTVNIVTDGLPALALAHDSIADSAMARGPRRGTALLPRGLWATLAGGGALVGLAGLGAYLSGRALDANAAQTMAFATIALAELAFAFSRRSERTPAWRIPRNVPLFVSVGLSALLRALVVYVPVLREPFGTVPLGPAALGIVAALALIPFGLIELVKAFRARATRR